MLIFWHVALIGQIATQGVAVGRPARALNDSVHFESIDLLDSLPSTTRSIVALLRPLNPELRALQSQVAAATTRRDASGLSSPLTLSGEAEEVPGAALHNAGSLRLDIQQQLRTGPRRKAERAVAETDVTRARALYAAGELTFTAQIVVLLETLAGGTIVTNRLHAEAQLLDDVHRGITARFAVGDARYVDVLRLRTERLRVMSEMARVTIDVQSARTALLALVAEHPSATQPLTALLDRAITERTNDNGDTSMTSVLPTLPGIEQALTLSLAVRTSRTDVDRSLALLALGNALRRPQVTGSLGLQRFGEVGNGNADRRFGITIAGSTTLPFTARRSHQRMAIADRVQLAATKAAATAASVATQTQLTVTMNHYRSTRDRLTAYDLTLLRGSREERTGARQAYRAGTMTLLELLDFERALVQAEVGYANARFDAVQAYANVIAVIAGSHDVGSMPSSGETRQ